MNMDNQAQFTEDLWRATKSRDPDRPSRLFQLDPQKAALVVVDMQNAFLAVGAPLELANGRSIVPNINRLARKCREVGIPVIWAQTVYNTPEEAGVWAKFEPESPIGDVWTSPEEHERSGLLGPGGIIKGDEGTRIYPELERDPTRDYDVFKLRYSAFSSDSSNIDLLLRSLGRDTLIFTGVGTTVCCETTGKNAMMLDYRVVFVKDANGNPSGFLGDVLHETTLMSIYMFCGDVVATDEVLAELAT